MSKYIYFDFHNVLLWKPFFIWGESILVVGGHEDYLNPAVIYAARKLGIKDIYSIVSKKININEYFN